MKKLKGLAAELAERAQLPAEALGEAKLSLAGGRLLLIENHSGLREYSSDRITVGCKRGRVVVSGTGLSLDGMNARELVLRGRIHTVEWEA